MGPLAPRKKVADSVNGRKEAPGISPNHQGCFFHMFCLQTFELFMDHWKQRRKSIWFFSPKSGEKEFFWRTQKKNSASLIVPSIFQNPWDRLQTINRIRWGLDISIRPQSWRTVTPSPFHSSMAPWLVTRRSHLFIKFKTWLNMFFAKLRRGSHYFLGVCKQGFAADCRGNTPVNLQYAFCFFVTKLGKTQPTDGKT